PVTQGGGDIAGPAVAVANALRLHGEDPAVDGIAEQDGLNRLDPPRIRHDQDDEPGAPGAQTTEPSALRLAARDRTSP
uniref:hypothetical protein n=1 Tax=Methylobacterium sp. CCH5-D2 TaxID=1768765 RepID=UPI0018D21963